MRQIPEFLRATSLADADIVLIAENYYSHTATIEHTEIAYGKNGDKASSKSFDSIEEMEKYISENEPVVTKREYYPVFSSFNLLSIYDAVTKDFSIFDYKRTDIENLVRNPEAADYWSYMEQVARLEDTLSNDSLPDRAEKANEIIQSLSFVDEDTLNFWRTCIKLDQFVAATTSVDEYYWKMAETLANLDGDENSQ